MRNDGYNYNKNTFVYHYVTMKFLLLLSSYSVNEIEPVDSKRSWSLHYHIIAAEYAMIKCCYSFRFRSRVSYKSRNRRPPFWDLITLCVGKYDCIPCSHHIRRSVTLLVYSRDSIRNRCTTLYYALFFNIIFRAL